MPEGPTVTCVGLVALDMVFSVDSLPSGSGKVHAKSLSESGGGPAATAAVAIAKQGEAARFLGPVGDDRGGRKLLAELQDAGVDTTRVNLVEGVHSSMSAVAVDEIGERAVVNHTDPLLFANSVVPVDADLAGSNAILCDTRWARGAAAALNWASEAGVPGVLDFDLGYGDNSLLGLASHVIFSAPALRSVTGIHDLTAALVAAGNESGGWIAVTDGHHGCYWLDEGRTRHMAAFQVEAIDTLGAGDIFHGIFAMVLGSNRGTIGEALRRATAAAALSCTRSGGLGSAPDQQELAAFLEEHG